MVSLTLVLQFPFPGIKMPPSKVSKIKTGQVMCFMQLLPKMPQENAHARRQFA